jgi:hypothetical protein
MLSLAEDVGGAGPLKVLGALTKPVTVEALASLLGNHLRDLSDAAAAT